jgi:5-methylcytosine-specific restriction endonuclease McrA
MSDQEILSRIRELTDKERKLTLSVLLHLNEIERRKLHLKRGHPTMFDYCTVGLGYSASAAMRRIQAARCIALFPRVHELLLSNAVNLSTVCLVSKVLTPENQADVLARICGKSQREVEVIVGEIEPLTALPRDRVRTVVVRVPAAVAATTNYRNGNSVGVNRGAQRELQAAGAVAPKEATTQASATEAHTNEYYRNGNNSSAAEPAKLERRAMIQFSASETFMAKVERVRSLASHRLPANASLGQVIEIALDVFLAKEDPAARQERRDSRKTTAARKTDSSRSPRSIPAPVRDAVFLRDQQHCTYKAPDGKPCQSTHTLQVDHIKPVARGGLATLENLRLLCAKHNRLEAERLMGRSGPRDGLSR